MGVLNEDDGKLIYLVPKQFSENSTNGIQGSTDRLILTATESFSRTDTAVVSNFPVSNNSSHGDHYRFNGSTINFKGVLSPDVLTLIGALTRETLPPIQNYIKKVRDVMRMAVDGKSNSGASPLFNVVIPDENTVNNCVITSFKISRDVKVSDGYYVEVTAQELLQANTSFSEQPKYDLVTKESNNGTDAPTQKTLKSNISGRINDLQSRNQ